MQTGLLCLLLSALLAFLLVYVKVQRLRGAEAKLVQQLELVGLRPGELELPVHQVAVSGTWAGRDVHARLLRAQLAVEAVRLELVVEDVLPGLSARLLVGALPSRAPEELPVGDASFDGRVAIRAEGAEGVARLTSPVRAALRRALEQGWTLVDGALSLRASWSGAGQLPPVLGWREVALALLTALDGAPASLSQRFGQEPDPELRRGLLMSLTDYGPEFVRQHVPPGATQDPDRGVAALAAALVGDAQTWDRAPPWAKVRALSAAPHQVVALHLRRRDEAALLELLRSGSQPVMLLAIQALGAVGSREAVPQLKPLMVGGPLGGPQSEAAKKAVAQIQARLDGAERGQVALIEAAPGAGELALAEGGGVALAREDGPCPT